MKNDKIGLAILVVVFIGFMIGGLIINDITRRIEILEINNEIQQAEECVLGND